MLINVGVPVLIGQRETNIIIPSVAWSADNAFGLHDAVRFEITLHVNSEVQVSIELFGLRVQVTIVAGERNSVSGPDRPREVYELRTVLLRIVYVGSAAIDDLETKPVVGRTVASQYEIDFRVTPQDLLERGAHDLAVIGVQDGFAVSLYHQNEFGEVPELITRNLKVAADLIGFAMDQLCDPGATHRLEVLVDAAVRGLRNKHMHAESEPAKGGTMKVVPVHVREVNKIRLERINKVIRNGWIIPPGAPIGGADQPWITQELLAVAGNLQTRMA